MSFTKQPAARFESETQRQYVEQDDVLDVARQHAALDRRTHRDDLVRIDLGRRLLAKYLGNGLVMIGERVWPPTRMTLSTSVGLQLCVPQSLLAGLDRQLDEVLDQLLEFLSSRASC